MFLTRENKKRKKPTSYRCCIQFQAKDRCISKKKQCFKKSFTRLHTKKQHKQKKISMKLVVIVVKEHKTQKHTHTDKWRNSARKLNSRRNNSYINESKLYTITREKKQKTQNKTDKFKIILILNNQISK